MNLFVVPSPAGTFESRDAGLARQLGAGGPGLRVEIMDTVTPGTGAEVARRCRELTAAWSGVRGIVPRLEATVEEAAPGGAMARDAGTPAGTPETVEIPDLNGVAVRAAFLKILARPGIRARATREGPGDGVVVAESMGASLVRLAADGQETLAVIAAGGTGRFSPLHARRGAAIAAAESLRRVTCAGAMPALLIVEVETHGACSAADFCRFAAGLLGFAEAAQALEAPVLTILHEAGAAAAGKGTAPIASVRVVGRVADRAAFRSAAEVAADTGLILFGEAPHELGGSRFLAAVHGRQTGEPPALDLPAEKRLQAALLAMFQAGVLVAAQPVAEGGMLVATCALLFGPNQRRGARLDLTPLGGARVDTLLFGESQGRVIAAVASERIGTVLAEAHMRGVPAALIGKVTDEAVLGVKTRSLAAEWPVADLHRTWQAGLGA